MEVRFLTNAQTKCIKCSLFSYYVFNIQAVDSEVTSSPFLSRIFLLFGLCGTSCWCIVQQIEIHKSEFWHLSQFWTLEIVGALLTAASTCALQFIIHDKMKAVWIILPLKPIFFECFDILCIMKATVLYLNQPPTWGCFRIYQGWADKSPEYCYFVSIFSFYILF